MPGRRRDFWGLDDSIGYLARIAFRRFSMVVNRRISAHGLAGGQLTLLCYLSEDTGLAQHVLGAQLGISEATVAVAVRRLEALGLAHRTINRMNRRETLAFRSERGRAVALMLGDVSNQVNLIATRGFSSKENMELADLLKRVAQNLHDESEMAMGRPLNHQLGRSETFLHHEPQPQKCRPKTLSIKHNL